MRTDQYEKLQALEEKLADVFIAEADSDKWPGHGIEANAMDQQSRGDRYWCKKNAFATLSLVQRISTLVGQVQTSGAGTTANEDEQHDLDAEVASAEREASKLLRKLSKA